MGDTEVTLAAVDEFIAAKRKALNFPDWLEQRFELDRRHRRHLRLRAATLANVVCYNLFLIPEWFLLQDQFRLSLLLHAFVVTPWIIFAGRFPKEESPKFLREALTASIPLAMALQMLGVFMLTASPDAAHYQYFVILVLLFTNTVQRLPYRYAMIVSAIFLILHALAVFTSVHLSIPIAATAVTTMTAAAYLTLISNYYLERDARRVYLHGLRDRLRHAEAEAVAMRDALTELGSRRLLTSRIDDVWGDPAWNDASIAMIMIDIDHFKLFNDRYGHVAGDLCLKRAAACVRAELRGGGDTAIRYGGEEILVLLPGLDLRQAIRMAERIRRSLEMLAMPHEAMGFRSVVTASFGVAAGPIAAIAAPELIAAADAALYAAKRNGRNQIWPPFLKNSEDRNNARGSVVALAGKIRQA
ncbi:GGDEF domain-containing protein [Terrarubrum flagellatum]|uniref:GGDEF domain-containing protein n=1 Tax=Terrirubrum flagellatum TaxID=2895980 RepID=UPI00314538A1